jgi:tetratricopeptide (TPR) repeat protein
MNHIFENYIRRLPALVFVAILLTATLLLGGCSTKKNTAMSRQWQAFNTRYNVYFNGSEHYKEQLKEMESSYKDDYTQRVLMHPAEARANEKLPQPSGDFKRTIEKMQKSIQLHSIKKKPAKKGNSQKEKEFRNREEFNPFLHNAWLMMGRAQYLNGDFLGAAATFFYIARHFKWKPEVVTEALLWQARCYCALDWNYEAENILVHIKEKQLTTSNLANLYNFVMGDYLVRSGDYDKAPKYLELAAKSAHGTQKNRIYFLLGQVYAHEGKRQQAYDAFRKAGSGAGLDYRAKFNARIKQSEVYTGTNIKSEVASLKAMTRFERNKEYFDQIYYAIGNLYLSRQDTVNAKENYRIAVEKSTHSDINKALPQLALGNILFAEGDYAKAQPCYSEAVPQLPTNYPDYKTLKKRSDVLDELSVYSGNVQLQDSLLDLSKMTEEEQMKVCKRLADEYKKKEKEAADAAKREEYLANQQGNGATEDPNAPKQYTLNNDKSWYFYNETTKNAGKTEFQRKWGARKLEDDWRRHDKTSYTMEEEPEDAEAAENAEKGEGADKTDEKGEDKAAVAKADNPREPEYYFKNIPKTPEELQNCNDIIQEGLYNMGVILKDKLMDYPAARKEFTTLNTRYPDNVYRLDVYYNMYMMAMRDDNAAEAEKYRQMVVTNFPESPYGMAMADPNYFDNLRTMAARQEDMYKDAYQAYLDDNNSQVHTLTNKMEADYPLSGILPKFVFIDALAYFTQKDYDTFKERLTYLLDKWPDTDMTEVAGNIMKGIRQGRALQGGGSNTRGMLWETRLSANTDSIADDGQPVEFERDPNKPQLLVLAFPRDSVNANQLLYDVARHNFSYVLVKDYDLEQMSFGNVGLLIVKGFTNMKELERYRSIMARENNFDLPASVRPIMISQANFELLLRRGRSFEEYFRFQENAAVEEVEATQEAAEDATEAEDVTPDEESDEQPAEAIEPAEEQPDQSPEEQPEPKPEKEQSATPEGEPNSEPEEATEEAAE